MIIKFAANIIIRNYGVCVQNLVTIGLFSKKVTKYRWTQVHAPLINCCQSLI